LGNITPESPNIYWSQAARECLQRCDYQGAAEVLSEEMQRTPGNAFLHCERAYYLLWAGDQSSACRGFMESLRIDPFLAPARLGLAAAYLRSGALLEAIDAMSRTSIEDPAIKTEAGGESISEAQKASDAVARFYSAAQMAFAEVQPPPLTTKHLKHSRIVPSREETLSLMPQRGVCAEIGTQTGYFAKKIIENMHPQKLHIYDIDFSAFDIEYFRPHINSGIVELHEGDSSTLLSIAPDGYFDFIYIDGDHTYPGVAKDLEQARQKMKPDGWIMCNDYTVYSPLEGVKYGVYRAVNELCLNHDFEIIYLGLHPWGYHDVALRKSAAVSDSAANGVSNRRD
jgi:SAM-dependent methyltransferase